MEDLWLMLATTLYNVFPHCLQILCLKKHEWKENNLGLIKFNKKPPLKCSRHTDHSTVFVFVFKLQNDCV